MPGHVVSPRPRTRVVRPIAGPAVAVACALAVTSGLALVSGLSGAAQADTRVAAHLADFKAEFRREALAAGIRAETFDREMATARVNIKAPDLKLPWARPSKRRVSNRGQAEFTKPPQAYLDARHLQRLARRGRALMREHRAVLKRIEAEIGVPASVVLAIWGRETAFGGYRLRNDAISALTTQAVFGRRKDMFRGELLAALRMIDDGVATRSKLKSSWAGAVGLTQFLPSEYYATAYDLDRDGRKDLWSVPDALASAANQLKQKGWVSGRPWGIEIALGPRVDCAMAGPDNTRTIGDWARLGVTRVSGQGFSETEAGWPAYLLVAGGTYGPLFLVTENYVVFRRYNMSDLYALFVGDLANRISGRGTFKTRWADLKQVRGYELAEIQSALKDAGFGITKIDGKLGSNTRSQIGLFQRARGLKVDCWPTRQLLSRVRARAK